MTDRTTPLRIAVIGGGVAGLATAWLLRELAGGRPLELSLLEAGATCGGSTRTAHVDGYTCEWGPNGFLDNEPATLDLVARLGLTGRLLRADGAAAKRYIFHGGAMRLVPVTPPAFLASDILPLTAKLRMACEPFIPARRDGGDESVGDFGRRRLGRRFTDYLLDPMVSGIFAGDINALSLPATFPKMAALERDHGGLFRALLAKRRLARRTGQRAGGPAGPGATLHTFIDGMGELTGKLADDLGDIARCDVAVRSVTRRAGDAWRVAWEGGALMADAVVLACPSHTAAVIIRDFDPQIAAALAAIPHAPVDVVCHGHAWTAPSHPLDGFGVLVPRLEGLRSLGTLWSDSIFPGQAPEGRRLLRTLLGGAHDPGVVDLAEEELHATVMADQERICGLRAAPEFRHIVRHARGIAQYTIGHGERLAAIGGLEASCAGLAFTGASYRGVSVNGCIKDAFAVAARLLGREPLHA